jgi:DNA-binding transcriptional LysR family regulator
MIVTPLIERLRIAAPSVLIDIVSVAQDIASDLGAGKVDVAIAAGWWLRHCRNREPLLRDQYVGISGNKNVSILRPMPAPSMFWWHHTGAIRASSTARCARWA